MGLHLLRPASWGCWLALAVLSLLPAEEMVRTSLGGHVEHAAAYAGAALVTGLAYRARALTGIAALLVLYAAALEGAQRLSPGRHAAVGDWIASSAGVLAGAALAALALRASRPRPSSPAPPG